MCFIWSFLIPVNIERLMNVQEFETPFVALFQFICAFDIVRMSEVLYRFYIFGFAANRATLRKNRGELVTTREHKPIHAYTHLFVRILAAIHSALHTIPYTRTHTHAQTHAHIRRRAYTYKRTYSLCVWLNMLA